MGEGATDDGTTAQEKNQFIAPCSGRLARTLVRTANSQASKTVIASVLVGVDGTADFNAGGSTVQSVTQSMPVNAATTSTFNFSGSSLHFAPGDIVGVKLDFSSGNSPGNCNVTCVWEFDDREIP